MPFLVNYLVWESENHLRQQLRVGLEDIPSVALNDTYERKKERYVHSTQTINDMKIHTTLQTNTTLFLDCCSTPVVHKLLCPRPRIFHQDWAMIDQVPNSQNQMSRMYESWLGQWKCIKTITITIIYLLRQALKTVDKYSDVWEDNLTNHFCAWPTLRVATLVC